MFSRFQSTPPVKAATAEITEGDTDKAISIHAAREGGDKVAFARSALPTISIHAAREGGDAAVFVNVHASDEFQSTPPVKAATAETNRRNQHFRKQQA